MKVMVIQGPQNSFQSAGANPLLLKCSGGGGGGTLKMVCLVPTQCFVNNVTTHQSFI